MLRANINIHALDANGHFFDYCDYIYNLENLSVEDFKKFIRENSYKIAEESCYNGGFNSLDFVCIDSIEFEDVDDDCEE
jgi:hypothetical protein